MGKNLTEIAALLIGVATITLLINRSGATVSIIKAGGETFNGLLRTVTLQSGYGNVFGG